MHILIIILLAIAAVIVLLLITALFMKKEHYVKRSVIVNTPSQKAFDYLKLLKNQDERSLFCCCFDYRRTNYG